MSAVTFALPSTDTLDRDAQGALLVNQAAALIVAAYLEYLKAVGIAQVEAGNDTHWTANFTSSNVSGMVDAVQDVLKGF